VSAAQVLALLSALCFGVALVTGRVGLRHADATAGAAVSIPSATVLLVLIAPFALDLSGIDLRAVLVFAAVGLVFPAAVTLLTFRSNQLLGPTLTSAVSGTSPLFAVLAGAAFLGERVPVQAALAVAGVAAGIALLSWKSEGPRPPRFVGAALLWPLAGAVVRALAQVAAKAGLMLWASPFAASLIGYLVSSATVVGADRVRGARGRRPAARAMLWFAATGILNGAGVLLMYLALNRASVWLVAPVVAAYPLVTALLGAALLHEERFSARALAGALLTVLAVGYLLGSRSPG
jgi:drug/metabolite transporter (DMT)-like permease